jgi:hypothetical protein
VPDQPPVDDEDDEDDEDELPRPLPVELVV